MFTISERINGFANPVTPEQVAQNMQPMNYPEMAGMYGAWEQEDMSGVVGVALDNSSLIIQINSFLSGKEMVEERDDKTGKAKFVWRQIAEPKMNDRGVKSIILELRARLDKNTIMSYFPDEERLDAFLLNFGINLFFFLGRNKHDFEIREGHIGQIAWFIIDAVETTLLRGLEGNEKRGVYKESKRMEHVNITGTPQMINNNNQRSMGVFR